MSTSGDYALPGAVTNPEAAVEGVAREPFALRALDRLTETTVVGALLGELLLVLANVIARVFFRHSFLWSDEVARLVLSILAFIGGAVAYRRRDHAQVRLVLNLVPRRAERVCLALADIIVFLVSGLIGVASIEFVAASWAERTPILQAPAALIALPLPAGMALMAIYAAARVGRGHGRLALLVALLFLAATALAATTYGSWLPALGDNSSMIAALVLFFAAIFAGVPVGFVLMLAAASYLGMSGAAPLLVLPQTMVAGAGNYILLAVPFFILAGLVMERGGISVRLIRFVHALVGHLRGGLLQVAVVSMYVTSGLSGSKPADVAAVGTVMRDEVGARHGAPEGAAVLAVSAIMGETVPPSIAMLIVGSITNVSVAGMFIGGLMPAAVIALCLMALIAIRARRAGALPAPRAPARMVARAGFNAFLPLLMPGMLLAGILLGLATPTEIAALAVVYGVVLAMFVYPERSDRIDAPCLFDGPINGERFRAYVEQFLVPTLKAGDVVILDNLGSHKGKAGRKAIRDVGARLVFLPKYSPDLNPIEQLFAKFKTLLRKVGARTYEAISAACGEILKRFPASECAAYIRNAGYA